MPINRALMALTCISEDSWSLPTGTAVQTQVKTLAHETQVSCAKLLLEQATI